MEWSIEKKTRGKVWGSGCLCLYVCINILQVKGWHRFIISQSDLQAFIKNFGRAVMLKTSILSLHDKVGNSKLVFREKCLIDGAVYRSNRWINPLILHCSRLFSPLQDTTTIEKMALFSKEMWVCLALFVLMPPLSAFLPRVSLEDLHHHHTMSVHSMWSWS